VKVDASRDYTENILVLTCYCADESWTKRQTERMLVNPRTVLHGLSWKNNKMTDSFMNEVSAFN
jgi:hypothetical protein